jgi:hypothetical protein
LEVVALFFAIASVSAAFSQGSLLGVVVSSTVFIGSLSLLVWLQLRAPLTATSRMKLPK